MCGYKKRIRKVGWERGRPRLTDTCGDKMVARLIRSYRRATVTQIALHRHIHKDVPLAPKHCCRTSSPLQGNGIP